MAAAGLGLTPPHFALQFSHYHLWRSGGTGRRAVFRVQCPCGRVGSNPTFVIQKPRARRGFFVYHDDMSNQSQRRNRRQQVSGVQIVFASILAIGLLLTINFSGRIRRGQQIEEVRQGIQATIDVLSTEQVQLLDERDYAASDAAVIEWAHRDGKMIREGEILVIPVPAGEVLTPTPRATPIPLSTPTPLPNWQLWWNLFFSGDPPF